MAAESCLLGLRAYEFPAYGSLFAAVYAFTRHPHNEVDRTLALVVGYSSCLAKSPVDTELAPSQCQGV